MIQAVLVGEFGMALTVYTVVDMSRCQLLVLIPGSLSSIVKLFNRREFGWTDESRLRDLRHVTYRYNTTRLLIHVYYGHADSRNVTVAEL